MLNQYQKMFLQKHFFKKQFSFIFSFILTLANKVLDIGVFPFTLIHKLYFATFKTNIIETNAKWLNHFKNILKQTVKHMLSVTLNV